MIDISGQASAFGKLTLILCNRKAVFEDCILNLLSLRVNFCDFSWSSFDRVSYNLKSEVIIMHYSAGLFFTMLSPPITWNRSILPRIGDRLLSEIRRSFFSSERRKFFFSLQPFAEKNKRLVYFE